VAAGLGPSLAAAAMGGRGNGRGVAQLLAAADQDVLDVPAKLAAPARLLGAGSARKIDITGAASVAAVAQRNRRLRPLKPKDHTVALWLTGVRLDRARREDSTSNATRRLTHAFPSEHRDRRGAWC
jgi:transposase